MIAYIDKAIDKTNATMRYIIEGNHFDLRDLCKIYSKEFNKGYITSSYENIKNLSILPQNKISRKELKDILLEMMVL